VRPAVVLGTNLVVGTAGLVWALHRFGEPAMSLLSRAPSAPLLIAFVLAIALGLAFCGLRWSVLLAGLGSHVALVTLTACRAAGHSLSSLVPSGRLGGDPLRAYLAVQQGVPAARAIASVTVDRTLEMGGGSVFAAVFGAVLVQQGLPALRGAAFTLGVAAIGLAVGVVFMVRRLRRGEGLLTAVASGTRLDRFGAVRARMATIGAAEGDVNALVGQPRRVGVAFGLSIATHTLVLVEYWLLLSAFGLPSGPVAVVAAIFATGAVHSMPVPAGIGVLEGSQLWLFTMLGYPADVGLAVGLAVRLRELLWVMPGLGYLFARAIRTSVDARRPAQS
jgi:glycosyltransferase 2 family protein